MQPNPALDSFYVAGVHNRDEVAFTKMVEAYVDSMTRYAFALAGEEDLAHDTVQDVFARVWHLGQEWNPQYGVAAYIYKAIRNRILDEQRNARTRERKHDVLRWSSGAGNASDPYDDIVLRQAIGEAMAKLTERQQHALQLRFGYGLTMSEISHILDIDLRATARLITRGLSSLRQSLGHLHEGRDRKAD